MQSYDNDIKYVDEKRQISVHLIDNSPVFIIKVYNTAPHISQKKLWDSFYKLDESRNRNVVGHGLELSIIKVIQKSNHLNNDVDNEKMVLYSG